MVFYNTLYGSFQEAASKSDGLAVIAVFLQVFYYYLCNSYINAITTWAKIDSKRVLENQYVQYVRENINRMNIY